MLFLRLKEIEYMKTLTVYHEQLKKYINGSKSTKLKKERLEKLKANMQKNNMIFEKEFPRTGKLKVLDSILYLLSVNGVCNVGGAFLALKSAVSIRTVREAVKAMKATNEFVFARLANGNAGKYVILDKTHENYAKIMQNEFKIFSPMEYQYAPLLALPFAPLQNAESVEPVSLNEEKADHHYNNSFSSFKTNTLTEYYTYKDHALVDVINGLLSKYKKPKEMLHELYRATKGIKSKFENLLKESILNTLIMKSIRALFDTPTYKIKAGKPVGYLSGILNKKINAILNPSEEKEMSADNAEPVSAEIVAPTKTDVFEEQRKINAVKYAKAKNVGILPDWYKNRKLKPQEEQEVDLADFEIERQKILAKLGIEV